MPHATFMEKINPILKKTNYTISCLLILVFFFVLMAHLNKEVRDLDIWLHLKTGEQIFLNKNIPLTDPFSFTKNNQPWINHEWLFQLISFTIYSKLGFDGLIAMQNIVFIALFLIIFFMGFKKRNFLFVSLMLFILLLNSSYRFTIRPDMFSALFLASFIFILKEKKINLYLLAVLQLFWTNFHGFFFLGPLVIFVFALTEKNRKLWFLFVLALLTTIINPQFIKGAFYPMATLFGLAKEKFIFGFIQELKMPFTLKTLFNFTDWMFYKALIIISIFSFRFNQKKFNITLFLLWCVFLLTSLLAIRNIIYFAIVAVIAILYNANERFSYDSNFSNEKFTKNKYYYLGRFSLIFVFSFCMLKNAAINTECNNYDFDNYNFKSCMWGLSLRNFPKKAVDFIINEKIPLRLFNDFNSGSYLIGRAYPPRKVFIDGRTEFYGEKFLKEYKNVTSADKKAVEEAIKKYDLQGFILTMAMSNFDEQLAKYLLDNTKWKPVYFDETAIIFLKDIPENKNTIKKFYIDLKAWTAPLVRLEEIGDKIIYPYKNIKRGSALREMGCFKAAKSEARQALKIMPNCAEAFELLGSCSLELKEYGPAMENLRIAVALAPQELGWRNKFALSLYKLGHLKEAETQLLKLVKYRPKDADNYHALATVYIKRGNLRKAEKMMAKACEYGKNNFDFLRLWADILYDLKKYRDASKAYKLALKIQPENPEIKKIIGNIEKIL